MSGRKGKCEGEQRKGWSGRKVIQRVMIMLM